MKHLLVLFFLCFVVATGSAQVVHDFATVEFSPGIRKVGVFSTAVEAKVIDLKAAHMDKRDLDIIAFYREVQALEQQGWEVTSQDVVALDRGVHMYVWNLRRVRP